MAEIAAISTAFGIASSIIGFIDVASRVLKRLNEYRESATNVPVVIRHITSSLPVVVENIERLARATESGSPIPLNSPLAQAISACSEEIDALDALTSKLVRVESDSKFKLLKKSILSIRYEKEISTTWSALQALILILTPHFTNFIETVNQQKPVASSKPAFNVPFARDQDFVGRTAIFVNIDQGFKRQTRIALAGIGGVGFATKHPDRHIFWVHAGNQDRFCQAYDDIARQNSIPGWDDPQVNKLQRVSEWLAASTIDWLMILDNADDLNTFRPLGSDNLPTNEAVPLLDYIPNSRNGLVLITTRDKRVGETLANGNHLINIPAMDAGESRAMLRLKISDTIWDEADAETLIRYLEYLPLAITQAAAYIRQNFISLSTYLNLFRANSADLKELLSTEFRDSRRDFKTENSVIRTWKLSFDQINLQDSYAADILSLMAQVDRNSIPMTLLRRQDKGVVALTSALGTLQAFSFIEAEKDGLSFKMHRLVQISTQTWLELQGKLLECQKLALSTIDAQLLPGEVENWRTCETLLSHAQVILASSLPDDFEMVLRGTIQLKIAYYERRVGRHMNSLNSVKQAVEIFKRALGEEHKDTLTAMNNLGLSYLSLGEYTKAANLQEQILEVSRRVLGHEHRDTLTNMDNLASSYSSQGEYAKAASLELQVVEARKRTQGDEHPSTLTSTDNLALIYSKQGDYAKAAILQQHVLDVSKRVLGDEHPDTLTTLGNLAMTYLHQTEYGKAVTLQLHVCESLKRLLGDEHPDTLLGINNLASTYWKQGEYDKAATLELQVLEARRRVLGDDHPDTLTSMGNLGSTYRNQGKSTEAIELLEKAQKGLELKLGLDHPATVAVTQSLMKAREGV